MGRRLPILLITVLLAILPAAAQKRRPRKKAIPMHATAYSQHGTTAAGTQPKRGVVAADPKVLPLGSQIKVKGAGPYSGKYRVMDTGRKIRGRRIDVYVPSTKEAKEFGNKQVQVEPVKPPEQHP